MLQSFEITIQPAVEPVSLAEAKAHLRIDSPDEDTLVGGLAVAAREYVEIWLRRSLINRTMRASYDYFSQVIYLPRPPLVSVSSIVYVDNAGDEQTLSASLHQVDARSQPGRIVPAYAQLWPTTQAVLNAVTVTFVAGYGATSASVPESIRAAIKLVIGDLYEHREAVSVETLKDCATVERLLWAHRNWLLE